MIPDTRPGQLRLLHVGPRPDRGFGGGIDVAAWPLLGAQVDAGADVSLLVLGGVEAPDYQEATEVGVRLVQVPAGPLKTLPRRSLRTIEELRPDIVHFHSVFIPAHAQLARALAKAGIPYVLTPHAGLNLWRGRIKKAVYGALVEKPFFRRADVVFPLTEREEQLIRRWLGRNAGRARYVVVPNSIRPLPSGLARWNPPDQPRLVYLGRFDVLKKGLDRLVEIARLLPDVEVIAHGSPSGKDQAALEALRRRGMPSNIRFLAPVYGDEKTDALTRATMYIQPSRDDGFPMSVVEAMRLAVPVAVAGGCDLSTTVVAGNLGMLLPEDPRMAAIELQSALADAEQLRRWSKAGEAWTAHALAPKEIASQFLSACGSGDRAPGLASPHPSGPSDERQVS